MKHITFIGTAPPIKGISHYCVPLAEELSKNVKVTFLGFKQLYPDWLYPGGTRETETITFQKNQNLLLKNRITYYNPLSWVAAGFRVKSKIVHCQWWSIPTFPILFVLFSMLKLQNKKIILTVHSILPHEHFFLDKMLTKVIFTFVSHFITHTKEGKHRLAKLFKISPKRVSIVPIGIYHKYTSKIPTPKSAKAKLQVKSPCLLYFGNIRRYKGIDDLLKALAIVKKTLPNISLIIAGQPWIPFKEYDHLIKKLKLQKNTIKLLHYIPNSKIPDLFQAADLVVLPYKEFESQSAIGSMALAFGKPLLVTRVSGLPDLVNDEAAVVEPKNPLQLAKHILKILTDKKLQHKLAKDSKKKAHGLSWSSAATKTVQIYDHVASR